MSARRLPLLLLLAVALVLGVGGHVVSARAQGGTGGGDHGPDDHGGPGGRTVSLTISLADSNGAWLPARAQVLGADGHAYPSHADDSLMVKTGLGGYFYVNGNATLSVPVGSTRITLTRGFEWMPTIATVNVTTDTTIALTLDRFATPEADGWFSGDVHSHSRHPTLDYLPTPEQVREVALAEGLSVLHVLDNDFEFTGGVHALSDTSAILYYGYEYRNQTCGHAPLPGLVTPVGNICCLDPDPPYPMLTDLASLVHAQPGALIVLGHPHTTDNYWMTWDWPGAGLGRELPVLAGLGCLDAIDVASYSNRPELDTSDWYTLLNAGVFIPPSAGTDAVMNRLSDKPPGGWRVYVHQPAGTALDYATWLAAFAAGRSYISSFPLVSAFDVNGASMGDSLEVAGDSLVAHVHIAASCAIGVQRLSLVANGQEIWTAYVPSGPPMLAVDTTFDLVTTRPGWVLLRVDANPGGSYVATSQGQAYTSPVRITHGGAVEHSTSAMGTLLDGVNAFESFASHHYAWPVPWQLDTLLARTARARRLFAAPFATSPAPFALVSPEPGGTTADRLVWQRAADPDEQDRVTYTVRVGTDSTLANAWTYVTSDTTVDELELPPNHWYWWSVDASDRAGNVVHSDPLVASFFESTTSGVPVSVHVERPRAYPNPSHGAVWLAGFGRDATIFDMQGRRVASAGHGVLWSEGTPVWDGSDDGRPAAPGVYLARSATQRRPLRIVRVR